MSWSRSEVSVLIEAFEKHPCLYATKRPEYKNKHARIQALNAILAELISTKPDVTIAEVKTKFQSLKTTFLVEFRKQESSRCSGAGDEKLYTPTLWYFDKMYFVLEQQMPRNSIDSRIVEHAQEVDPTIAEDLDVENESQMENTTEYEVQEDGTLKVSSPYLSRASCSTPNSAALDVATKTRKRKLPDKAEIAKLAGAMTELTDAWSQNSHKKPIKSKFAAFANFVESKMLQMREDVADEVEEEIINILYKGVRKSKTQ